MDVSINRDEIFADNRDELFISRLCCDISRLELVGFNQNEIKRMIGTFPYVRVWCNTPNFLYPVLRLPKGYAWKNGQKFKCNYGDHRITYIFLPVRKDLYVKGIEVAGTHISDPKMAYIKDYKKLNGIEVSQHFDYMLSDIFLKYWNEHNLPLGFIDPVTRKFDIAETILKDYRCCI